MKRKKIIIDKLNDRLHWFISWFEKKLNTTTNCVHTQQRHFQRIPFKRTDWLVQLWYSFSLFDSFLVCHFIVEFWCGDERMIDIWLELKVQRVLKHRDLRVKRLFSDSFFSHNGLVCICLVSIFFLYWNEELAIFFFFSEQFFFLQTDYWIDWKKVENNLNCSCFVIAAYFVRSYATCTVCVWLCFCVLIS